MVTGFQLAALYMNSPHRSATLDLQIHLSQPRYFAVMTPCCSIEMKSIALAPLDELSSEFLSLPQLWDDLTSVNRQMQAERAVPPKKWEHLDATKRSEILAKGMRYVLLDYFIYDVHVFFEAYPLKRNKESRDFRHRLVNFKKIFRVDCSQIDRDHDAPAGVKLLQLTDDVRGQLRDKLAYFFGRVPDEDLMTLPTPLAKRSETV